MGLDATKHVFGVSDTARLKPVSSASETSQKLKKCTCSKLEMINNKGADQSVRMRRLVCAFCCSETSKTCFFALRPINNAGLLSFYIDMSVIVNVTQLYLEDLTCVFMHFKAYQTS